MSPAHLTSGLVMENRVCAGFHSDAFKHKPLQIDFEQMCISKMEPDAAGQRGTRRTVKIPPMFPHFVKIVRQLI